MINKCQYGIICFISSGSHIIHIANNKVLTDLNSEWLKSLLYMGKKYAATHSAAGKRLIIVFREVNP